MDASHRAFSPSSTYSLFRSIHRNKTMALSSSANSTPSYPFNPIVYEAVRLLGPPARFEASKLKVVFMGEMNKYAGIIPRAYILSHCDFTANLTLTISNVINLDQLKGWYHKDDVIAEWKKVKGEMCLHVHCYVSGPNSLLDLTAEFRYHIFSKELPLVLKSVVYGDSVLFGEHPELLDSLVRVYFHSSSQKYNRLERWGPLKDLIEQTCPFNNVDLTLREVVCFPGETQRSNARSFNGDSGELTSTKIQDPKIHIPSTVCFPSLNCSFLAKHDKPHRGISLIIIFSKEGMIWLQIEEGFPSLERTDPKVQLFGGIY